MASFEDSPPPDKKRKTITTHGSQSAIGRALRAVKNAVPGTLLSSDRQPQNTHANPADGASGNPITLRSQTHRQGLDKLYSKDLPSSKINGFHPPGAEHQESGHDRLSSTQRETRASKQAHDKHLETSVSTPRKRRKYGAETGLQDRHALSSPVRKVNGSVSTTPQDTGNAGQYMDELDAVDDHGSNPMRRESPHNDQRTVEALPNDRPQRKLRERPRRDEDSSMKSSIKRGPNPPETPVGTPGRKPGRSRYHPTPAPISPDAEENEMGFRKITTDERPPSTKAFVSSTNGRTAPKTQHLSNVQADVQTNGKHTDTHDPLAKAARIRDGHKTPGAEKLKRHFKEPDVRLRQQDDIFDISTEAPTFDQKLPEVLQRCTAMLQKLLKTCSDDFLSLFKAELLDNLTGKHSHLVNFEEETRKLHQLVTQTVLAGEGNSMLVIGPRGCGKTTLVESVLSDLALEHNDDFIVIRLSGFIHTDDKLALREIWRQLGREVAAEDEATGIRTNYADTLTSLLALLAHSSEDDGSQDETTARSVVFVIDEFDLFTSHPRQTLLYNLFDVAQSRNAPIAVLGLTTRTDVVESLEKRVKSRFGQRYIYLSHPKSFNSFEAICRSALASRDAAGETFSKRTGNDYAKLQQVRVAWNEYVDALFNHDTQLDKSLRYLFAHSNCVANFKSSMLLPIRLLSASNIPTGESIMGSSLPRCDSKLQLLPSLSDLELSLLIAAARLDVILDANVCNFRIVYDEYVQLASRVKLQSSAAGQTAVGGGARVWGKDVARGAWERLMDLELILTANTAGSRSNSNSAGVMCRVDVALEEIGPSVPRLGATMSKWCKEI
ncbi:MAG: hypothetical protein L6R38_007482 [Xanthoria sp. 2 TBL-2021]|nr:MAG: hypothetical protein L6R38_007482 [Xanthoria sp. 2 TBL-2021]